MMKEKLLMLVLAGCLWVSACGSGPARKPETDAAAGSAEIIETEHADTPEYSDGPNSAGHGGAEEGDTSTMEYDFREYSNVNITGVDLASLSDEQLAVLYAQAKYCQAMTEADIDTMRELVELYKATGNEEGRHKYEEKIKLVKQGMMEEAKEPLN